MVKQICIFQKAMMEIGVLGPSRIMVLYVLLSAKAWAKPITIKGKVYYYIDRLKIIELLPIIKLKPDTVYRHLLALSKLGIIKFSKLQDEDAYSLLNTEDSKTGCLFCGDDDMIMHNHHYPIRAKNNGESTIKLCIR